MGSIIALPNDYVVVDLETTGLDYDWDSIIEIAALRVRNGEIVDRFEQLIKLDYKIPVFITSLTGITDQMLDQGEDLASAISYFDEFIGDDILIGHNVNFDIQFLKKAYDKHLHKEMTCDYVDTLRISRRVLTGLQHHRLCDIAQELLVPYDEAHRGGADCETTNLCYRRLREIILDRESEAAFLARAKKKNIKPGDIQASKNQFDIDHPLYQRTVVFTGALTQMLRSEAMQRVVDCGGICGASVTKQTNYLVVGTSDYISAKEGKKTSKMMKVEQLRTQGYDIATISEEVFLDLLNGTQVELTAADQLSVFPEMPSEEWIFESLRKSLEQVISENNVALELLKYKEGKSYSSVWYGTQMAFRICCRDDHHYFGISSSYADFAPDNLLIKITSDGRSEGFINFEFDLSLEGIMAYCSFLASVLDSAIDSVGKGFDCCSRYLECSNAKQCVNPHPFLATECGYRKIMKHGRIFYGKNRNID